MLFKLNSFLLFSVRQEFFVETGNHKKLFPYKIFTILF